MKQLLHSGFLASAVAMPDRPDLHVAGRTTSCRELLHDAMRIAAAIQRHGRGDDSSLTAVFADRTKVGFTGILGALFLFFTVAIPAGMLAVANNFLKNRSTESPRCCSACDGNTALPRSNRVSPAVVAIEVADACSGSRSSIGPSNHCAACGPQFLARPWKKVALLLAIAPITIFKSAVRIVTLSLLSIHVDRSYLTGQLHYEGGVVLFVLALGLLTLYFLCSRAPKAASWGALTVRGRPVAIDAR